MFSDGQLKQLRELLEPLYKGQDDLRSLIIREAKDLGEAVGYVGERVDVVAGRVDVVQSDVKNLTERVDVVQSDVKNLTERVDVVQADVKNLIERVGVVQTDVKNLTERVDVVQTDVKKVNEKVNVIQTDVKKLEGVVVKEASDLGEAVSSVGVRVDEAQKEAIEIITENVNPVLKDHDKRITRIERNLDLTPLE